MVDCRCEMLNVMSGDVARDYAGVHLQPARVDGMGRNVLRCPTTDLEWVEETDSEAGSYAANAVVLRRLGS